MARYIALGVLVVIAAILIFVAMQTDVAHIGAAGKAALSEFFSRGNGEHIAAEIPLTPDTGAQGENSAIGREARTSSSNAAAPVSAYRGGIPTAISKKSVAVSASGSVPAYSAAPSVSVSVGTPLVRISEIMAGTTDNPSYEFIELVNRGDAPADLSGWSIKKKTSSGSESTLVSSARLSGKIIPPQKHFLLANAGGWTGTPAPDVLWPQSYSLSYTSNTIVLYNASGTLADAVSWSEIPAGKSYAHDPETGVQFVIENVPTPQNSGDR